MSRSELIMSRPDLKSIDVDPEVEEVQPDAQEHGPVASEEARAELLPARRPAREVALRRVRVLAELPPPVVAAGGLVAGAAIVSGVKLIKDARTARALRKRKRQAGPLVAIVSERIQIDLRTLRRQ